VAAGLPAPVVSATGEILEPLECTVAAMLPAPVVAVIAGVEVVPPVVFPLGSFHRDFQSILNDHAGPAQDVTVTVTDSDTSTVVSNRSGLRAIVRKLGSEPPDWIRDKYKARDARWAMIVMHGADFADGVHKGTQITDAAGRVWDVRDYDEVGVLFGGVFPKINLACTNAQRAKF
jgi:hypothetical protein